MAGLLLLLLLLLACCLVLELLGLTSRRGRGRAGFNRNGCSLLRPRLDTVELAHEAVELLGARAAAALLD